ncbi:MAG: hypothetical protein ABI292_01965, partial [Rhodoferax sp.]
MEHGQHSHNQVIHSSDARSAGRAHIERHHLFRNPQPPQYAHTEVRLGAASLHPSVNADNILAMYRTPLSAASPQVTIRFAGCTRRPDLWAGMGIRTRMPAA